jgi:hypothetical protein
VLHELRTQFRTLRDRASREATMAAADAADAMADPIDEPTYDA